MEPRYETTLEVLHEAMRDGLNTVNEGARALSRLSVGNMHNNQLLESLAEHREKYKLVVSGMKVSEQMADAIDVISTKAGAQSAPLFEKGGHPREPVGVFVDAPAVTICIRCDKTLRKNQEPDWVPLPEGGTAKIHRKCLKENETTNLEQPPADGAPADADEAEAQRIADAEPGAVKHPGARKPKLKKLSAKKRGYRMTRT